MSDGLPIPPADPDRPELLAQPVEVRRERVEAARTVDGELPRGWVVPDREGPVVPVRTQAVNTHRALLECCYPSGMTLIASGDREFCTAALERWLDAHPLPQWTSAYVVEVVAETQCEPGVGVYTVPFRGPA